MGLGGFGAKIHCEASLFQTFIGPIPFLSAKVTSVVALAALLRSRWTLLKALNKGVDLVNGEGVRQCLGVPGMCGRRPLDHTLGFVVLSFVRSKNFSVGKSFVTEVGHTPSMLHKSNLLVLIFQGNLHSNKRVVVQFITIVKEEG